MAYCVNCGVELEKSLRRCPLCSSEVVNPKEPYDERAARPYSSHIVGAQVRLERKFVAIVITVFMLLAAVVCVMANLVYQDSFTWSGIVVASLTLLWVLMVFPFVYPGLNPVIYALLDVMVLFAFLYIVNLLDPGKDWYLTLAMPQVLVAGVVALIDISVIKSKRTKGFQSIGLIIMSLGALMMGLEAILDIYNDMTLLLQWSWFIIIPAFTVGLLCFMVERKREIKEKIIRRLRF